MVQQLGLCLLIASHPLIVFLHVLVDDVSDCFAVLEASSNIEALHRRGLDLPEVRGLVDIVVVANVNHAACSERLRPAEVNRGGWLRVIVAPRRLRLKCRLVSLTQRA